MKKIPYLAFWIYLVCAFTIPFVIVSVLDNYGYAGTGEGYAYDVGSLMGYSFLIGGIILGLYYAIKSTMKKQKEKTKSLGTNSN